MSVVVVGSANIDIVLEVDAMPRPGETVLATSRSEYGGGKGLNQVVAAARAGCDAALACYLGHDAGSRTILSLLNDDGVTPLVRTTTEPTGTATVLLDAGGENMIVVTSGANAAFLALDDAARDAVAAADVLLLQLEVPVSLVAEAVQVAGRNRTTVVLNAAPARTLSPDLLKLVDVLVVNEHEAEVVARTSGDAAATLQALLLLVPVAVVTLGGRGALLGRTDDGVTSITHYAAPTVDVVDTTGAGDTFCGALVAELDRGSSLEEAVAFGTAAGSVAVQTAGAVPSIPFRHAIVAAMAATPAGA